MKKKGWKERMKYRFDNLMSKGTVVLVGMLFAITLIVVLIAGILSTVTGNGMGLGNNIWMSLQHAIDAGTLAGDDTANILYIVLMALVTVCGIFITSILIGIITTGFEEKLTALRKGRSCVVENGHTVILGFNDHIYTLISELIIANENQAEGCIVIIGDEDKEEMDQRIAEQISDFKNTRIICRAGTITEYHSLKMASLETCRSVIINETDDFLVIKSILAIVNYLKSEEAFDCDMHISAMIDDELNYEAALIAGEGKAELIYTQDAIARIIAHTCRQPGLSNVLIELFDYDGDELYFEKYEELEGKRFGEILNYFDKAVIFGLKRENQILLNPSKDLILKKDDLYIVLEDDDGVAKPVISEREVDTAVIAGGSGIKIEKPETILILGMNAKLPKILEEMNHYVVKDTKIVLAMETECQELKQPNQYPNMGLQIEICDIDDRRSLDRLITDDINHVLILSDLECEIDLSDAKTLLKLIHLRDIAKKKNQHFNITSEMLSVENQRLAKVTKVNDFVVGTNIINLILTQISENRDLTSIFTDLLDEEGSEIYMKKISKYVEVEQAVDFRTITESACKLGEIAIGYKKVREDGSFEIVTNPDKREKVQYGPEDYLIVLAED